MEQKDPKQQVLDTLKNASSVLVTVSSNPSVDQLAACIGLSLVINKLGKHGTAVFSGQVPSAIEFLNPDETFQKTTDSLQDFIIAIDKAKADKLRYKVENDVVRIFITPFKTTITEKDLKYSQGEINVDAVVTLGVHNDEELDKAISAHGKILHNAPVVSINIGQGKGIGSVNWSDPKASSLSEAITGLVEALQKDVIDSQIANALLTGIVAETNRFSNEKTSHETMGIASRLMAAGANQQLIVTKLEQPGASVQKTLEPKTVPSNVSSELEIDNSAHDKQQASVAPDVSAAESLPFAEPPAPLLPQPDVVAGEASLPPITVPSANQPEPLVPASPPPSDLPTPQPDVPTTPVNNLSLTPVTPPVSEAPKISHIQSSLPAAPEQLTEAPADALLDTETKTQAETPEQVDSARDAVLQALGTAPKPQVTDPDTALMDNPSLAVPPTDLPAIEPSPIEVPTQPPVAEPPEEVHISDEETLASLLKQSEPSSPNAPPPMPPPLPPM